MELKDVVGYEGYYKISDEGVLHSVERYIDHPICGKQFVASRIMKVYEDQDGYYCVNIQRGNKEQHVRIHRLVAQAFIPNPENKPQVNHKDGNKKNNHVDNLEWCTNRENVHHAIKTGLKRPQTPSSSKRNKRLRCIETGQVFESINEASRVLGVSSWTIESRVYNCARSYTKRLHGLTFEFI